MQRTNIYLDESQCAALDERAKAEGVSRAELIRRLLDRALAGNDDDLAGDLAALDASFGAVELGDVAPRGRDERAAHLERVWRRKP
jgi:hypothetical protein